MNNTIGLGYVVTPVPTSPVLFFSKPLPIMQMILRFYKKFDFMLKTTKYWYINYWHSASQYPTLYRNNTVLLMRQK